MADFPLQNDSARATGEVLTLHSACLAFEDIQSLAEELTSLLHVLSSAADLDRHVANSLCACSDLALNLAKKSEEQAGLFIAAHWAERTQDGVVANFEPRPRG